MKNISNHIEYFFFQFTELLKKTSNIIHSLISLIFFLNCYSSGQHELFYNILTRITTKANRNKKGLNKSTGKKIINLRSKDDQNCHCQVHSMQKVHSSKMKLQQIAKPTKFGLFHLLLISFSWFWAFHLLLILLCLQFVNADIQGKY